MFKRYTNKNLEFIYSALLYRHLEWIVKLQWFSLLFLGIYLLLKGYFLPALCAAGLGISFSFMNFLILNILAELILLATACGSSAIALYDYQLGVSVNVEINALV